jgi:ectoine hydroxylase-related dioxygenase (phytanoyl-CoA dioxygenase family)
MRKITDDEIRFFDDNGFVICKGVLKADELAHIQEETRRLIDEVLAGGPADKKCGRGPEGIPYYLNYLHSNPNTFSLRLLAHPFVGDLLTRMVGPDFIPLWESLVFKLPGNGSSVPWHRDDHSITGDERVFNIDIYPDYSTVENSCVWAVPGSHKWAKEQALEWIRRGQRDFDLPGAVPAEMQPGDVLLHHVKVLHGSTVNHSKSLRRVIYFDNRAASWNAKYGWFTPEVLERRCLMYQYALHERKTNPYPGDDETFDYQVPAGMPVWHPGDPVDLYARREG